MIYSVLRFYIRDMGMGVLYLCFSGAAVLTASDLIAIPIIAGIIEGTIYLTKSDIEFQRQFVES